GLAVALTVMCLALVPLVVRGFERLDRVMRLAGDARATGASALAFVALALVAGGVTGDSGGVGGAPGVGILGVLRRPGLDLRAVVGILFVIGASYATSVILTRRRAATRSST